MLEGFDESWNEIGTRRFGNYTNLPGGTYTLRMMGSNNDGIWNDEGSSLQVNVIPPFWATWWFRGIALLTIIGIAMGGYRLRIRSLEARSRHLETQVGQRTAELRQEMNERIKAEETLRKSEREKAVAEERGRLARDLHDSVTQSLFAVTMYADAADRHLAKDQADMAAGNVRKLRRTAREALGEMRLLVYELRPLILEVEGLETALETRLEAVEKRAGLQTEFMVDVGDRLPHEIEEGLYRIAQESLNNILKHAQAKRVIVSLSFSTRSNSVILEITDDGVGFDPVVAQEHGGLGLRGIAERADQMGARLELVSEPGAGTTVRVQLEIN
jgi:signal transduction histidine kinase